MIRIMRSAIYLSPRLSWVATSADAEIDMIDCDALAVMARQAQGLDDRFRRHARNPSLLQPRQRMIWIMGGRIS
jgi:hypothetical protein